MAKKQFVKMSGKDWSLTDNPADAFLFSSNKSAQKAKRKLEHHTNYLFVAERDEARGTITLVALSKG